MNGKSYIGVMNVTAGSKPTVQPLTGCPTRMNCLLSELSVAVNRISMVDVRLSDLLMRLSGEGVGRNAYDEKECDVPDALNQAETSVACAGAIPTSIETMLDKLETLV